jgi:hypothetical protein
MLPTLEIKKILQNITGRGQKTATGRPLAELLKEKGPSPEEPLRNTGAT